ncbi:MAG: ATP-binding protein [Acidobacteriaceae bacterium]
MLAKLIQRLKSRSDSEHEQAAIRIIIVGLILAYMALFHGSPRSWTSLDWHIILMLCGFLLTALVIFAAICLWPERNVPRRLVGMLADNGGSTWYMCLAGEYGFSMIGVFLFVTFGNGFRYGRRYLFASQTLSLVGYTAVIAFVPYWQGHRSAGVGLLIALVVLPLYVSTLLKRVQEARAKAEEANLAKTSFLANMSHEMRTPLNGIVGVVDLLRTTALSAQQGELVNLLRHSISVLRSLVDDVLDITKIEAGRLTIEVAAFDLHACINGLTQLLRPHAEAKGLALNAMVDPALEYRLKGDVHHLRQILMNLLGNAIKFTERGEVKLTASLKQESENGVTARFEVTDTGIGIAADALPRIFERFVQADQSTTRKYGGTGLGTTIAKQLTELMGGSIGVNSTLGEGTTFWVELPLLKDQLAVEGPSNEKREPEDQGLCLVINSPGYGDVTPALGSIGERYEVLPSPGLIASRVEQLRLSGTALRAVVAACPVEQACAALHATTQRLCGAPVAFIYVANDDLSVVDRARVNSIKGAYALDFATPRLVANAIHAVTAGAEGATTSNADLSALLKRSRTSLRILVAEDNATNQRIISQLLESAGHTVMIAGDGEAALDVYESEQPDMAILDFNMPRRSGIEVIQAIRMMEPVGMRMPAMILSASVTVEARERARAAGADEFVGKPFDAASLVAQIDRLSQRIARRTARAPEALRNPAPKPARTTPPSSRLIGAAGLAIDQTLIDVARLEQLQDIARDRAFLGELLAGFTTDVDAILARTQRAMLGDAQDSIADLMHSLRGAAVGVGATKLAELAEAFDKSASSMSTGAMRAKFDEVRRCYESTSDLLQQFLRANLSLH